MYQERKQQGICTRCGKRKAIVGKTKCAICLEKDAFQHRKARFNKINVKEYRKENHLCYYCGKPIDRKTGQLCQACWDKSYKCGLKSSHDNEYWKADNNIVFKYNR